MAFLLVFGLRHVFAGELTGQVERVVDGDGFVLAGTEIRLCGIDAPERGKPGYHEATAALEEMVRGQTVRCIGVGEGTVCDGRSKRKSGKRLVAQCFLGDIDIAALLVDAGHACDWVKFSGNHYGRDCPTGWR